MPNIISLRSTTYCPRPIYSNVARGRATQQPVGHLFVHIMRSLVVAIRPQVSSCRIRCELLSVYFAAGAVTMSNIVASDARTLLICVRPSCACLRFVVVRVQRTPCFVLSFEA